MMNFLTETIDAIQRCGQHSRDIIFIGSEWSGYCCIWEEFEKLADFSYDGRSGFGSTFIAQDLVIIFSDGARMRRSNHVGVEGWCYEAPFFMPLIKKPLRCLGSDKFLGHSLGMIHEKLDKPD